MSNPTRPIVIPNVPVTTSPRLSLCGPASKSSDAHAEQRDPFADALADLERKMLDLRDALSGLAALAPVDDPKAWIDTMLAPATLEMLGACTLLCDGNQAWTRQMTSGITSVLANNLPAETENIAAAFTRGMVRSAMSCPCGICPFCAARAEYGDKAEEIIARHLAGSVEFKRAPSKIVGANGRPLS